MSYSMEQIKEKIKEMIIERLELDIEPEEIENDAPLFDEGLGLDSVEGLEITVGLEETFDILIESDEPLTNEFYSIDTLAEFINSLL
ncbi:MAG: hypothetical protein KAX49_05455 [Halanaerobiales bacterium]|nr:hypothetical protein [Halanaerobiales bacterium]